MVHFLAAADMAYAFLMGTSAAANIDHVSESMPDDLIIDDVVGVLREGFGERGERHGENGARGRRQACAQREAQDDLVDELESEMGGADACGPHSRQQAV